MSRVTRPDKVDALTAQARRARAEEAMRDPDPGVRALAEIVAMPWRYEDARRVLNEIADDMVERSRREPPYRSAQNMLLVTAARLYHDARQARGIKSEVAFRRRARHALLEAGLSGDVTQWMHRIWRRL